MAIAKAENTKDTGAAIFFGGVLCVLLAFFAVERRVAAYLSHRVAATTIAAAGVQKPQQIAFTETQTLRAAPVLFLSILLLFAAASLRRIPYSVEYHRLRMCPGLRYHSPSMVNTARSRSTLRPHRITIAHGRFAHPCLLSARHQC